MPAPMVEPTPSMVRLTGPSVRFSPCEAISASMWAVGLRSIMRLPDGGPAEALV